MIRLSALCLMLAVAGCNTGGGYYAPGVDLGLHGRGVMCSIPAQKSPHIDAFYVFTNTAEACRSVGGKPAK